MLRTRVAAGLAAMGLATFAVTAFAQRVRVSRRANELTLAGLRPGRDALAVALKRYTPEYLSRTTAGADRKQWLDLCTGRSLGLDLDEHLVIQGITLSSLGPKSKKCDDRLSDLLDEKNWRTEHGLRLGDPQRQVINIYGKPDSNGPSVRGKNRLEFLYYAFDWAGSNVPQVMEVYCSRDTGRVVEITLAYPSL